MKISKLFHWLYATLMFLPFIFLLPTLAYYGFNEHATNTETTTINYKYQSNEVNTLNDLVEGNVYNFKCEQLYIDDIFMQNEYLFFELLTDLQIDSDDLLVDNTVSNNILIPNKYYLFEQNNDGDLLIKQYSYTDFQIYDYDISYYYQGLFNSNCIIRFYTTNISNDVTNFFDYTNYNVIESVEVNTDNTITSSVARSWNSVWNLPLFSWTHNSFVAEPFTYITGLFGMSADNPFNYVVTYFVSISVCWLVFDFLMYVPNLAHRWLDKGALE